MDQKWAENCKVCGDEGERSVTGGDYEAMKCPRCGQYTVTGSAAAMLNHIEAQDRPKLSGWTRARMRENASPRLDSTIVKSITKADLPSLFERGDAMLAEAAAATKRLGDRVGADWPRIFGASYSSEWSELMYLARYLAEQGWVQNSDTMVTMKKPNGASQSLGSYNMTITPGGYVRLDEIRSKPGKGSTVFVAMSFSEAMQPAYTHGIALGILDAGYEPRRVDDKQHNERIDDEIMALLNTCAFVVGDLTRHSAGVYFEIGYARGKSLPVIHTCQADDMEKIHFDIRQFNCVKWIDADDLRKQLRDRIVGTIGPGPLYQMQ